VVLAWVAAIFLVPDQAQPVSAGEVGYALYYILGDEEDILVALQDIPSSGADVPGNAIRSTLSIVAAADGTSIYLDEWEDGYDFDDSDPDNTADAKWDAAPGGPGEQGPALNKGDVLTLRVTYTFVPGSEGVDGGDRLFITGAASVVRTVWPETPGTYLAGSWELYPLTSWQNSYVVPVGEDLDFAPDSTLPFEYTFLFIEAAEDNTQVVVTDRTGVELLNISLDQGDNIYLPDINAGTTVTAIGLIQAGLITSVNGVYDTRYYTLTPEEFLCNEYYLPVPSMQFPEDEADDLGRTPDVDTAAYIYAFEDDTEVTIETSAGTETVTLDAGEVHRYVMPRAPEGTIEGPYGARITGSDKIWILVAGDDDDDDLDWGYQAMCAEPPGPGEKEQRKPLLGSDYYLPFAPANPLHITPVDDDTTFYVDWDGDGADDETFTLDRFETRMLFPTSTVNSRTGFSYDATGAHIHADGRFAMAWGQDNTEITDGEWGRLRDNTDLDFGYTVVPLLFEPVLGIGITVDPPSLPCNWEGEAVTFTMTAYTGDYPMYGIDISNTLPSGWLYQTGTTTISFSDGTDPRYDDPAGAPAGPNLLWALDHDLGPQQSITVTFETIPPDLPGSYKDVGYVYGEDGNEIPLRAQEEADVEIPGPDVCIIELAKTVYLCRDDGGAGCPGDDSVTGANGAHVTYCFEVTNTSTGNTYLDDITIADDALGIDETQMTLLRGSTPLAPGASLVYYYEGTINGDLVNKAKTEGNPTDAQGNDLQGVKSPDWSDTATVKEESQPTIIELSKTVYADHDGGAGCPGSESVKGNKHEPVTYCFEVTNTGNTYLDDITIADDDLGIDETQMTWLRGSTPLAPGDSLVYYYEGTINGDLDNKAKTQGIPTDAEGNDLPCLADPTDEDTAAVRTKDHASRTPATLTPVPTSTPTLVTPTATVPVLIVERLPETGRSPGWVTIALGVPLLIGAASILNLALLEKRSRRGDGKGH